MRHELLPRKPHAAKFNVWTTVVSVGLSLLALPVYMLLLDVPLFRSSGLPAFVLLGVALTVAVMAAARRKTALTQAVALFNGAFLVAFAAAFFWLAALPKPTTAAFELARAPDLTLWDHNGKLVSLSNSIAAGPVLLVFYRGHW